MFKYIQIPLFKRNDYEARGWELVGYLNFSGGEPSHVEMKKRVYGYYSGRLFLPGHGFTIWV